METLCSLGSGFSHARSLEVHSETFLKLLQRTTDLSRVTISYHCPTNILQSNTPVPVPDIMHHEAAKRMDE
jgi:hypothetical protein